MMTARSWKAGDKTTMPRGRTARSTTEHLRSSARTGTRPRSRGKRWSASRDSWTNGGRSMDDQAIRAALERHWSDVNDQNVVHEIYHDDMVLEFPQGGE